MLLSGGVLIFLGIWHWERLFGLSTASRQHMWSPKVSCNTNHSDSNHGTPQNTPKL